MYKYFKISIHIALTSLNTRIYICNSHKMQFMPSDSNRYISITPRTFKVPILRTSNQGHTTYTYIHTLSRLRINGDVQGGSNMTGTNCDLFTHNQSRSYLNHLVLLLVQKPSP